MNVVGSISVRFEILDQMMPMHVLVGADECITHVGPTLAKTMPGATLVGKPFFHLFEPRRTQCHNSIAEACAKPGTKVYLRLRDDHKTPLIGTASCLPGHDVVLINLSFGISVIDAVGRYNLAGSDFAATDLTLEMLYLVEAKTAALAESSRLNHRLHGAKQAAEADAGSDQLTGLANRRVLDQKLNRLIARGMPFTLMHLDLDHFKAVNDCLGHAAGDYVLTTVARILNEEIRAEDVAVRVGGDEFVLVLDAVTDPAKLKPLARRLLNRLEQPIPFRDDLCRISGSIGMVTSTTYAQPVASRMMEDADSALYESKDRGRACYTLFRPDALEAQAVTDAVNNRG